MPVYTYKHPETHEETDVFQGVNDTHEYFAGGVKWKRVFTPPNVGVDLKGDPFSHTQFLDKTNKGATMGEIWDRAQELSSQRAEKCGGIDPHKKKAVEKKASDLNKRIEAIKKDKAQNSPKKA